MIADLPQRRRKIARLAGEQEADICLIAEGCYPYVPGGVSTWIDWLMRSMPARRFAVVALLAAPSKTPPRYKFPDNLVDFSEIILSPPGSARIAAERLGRNAKDIQKPLYTFMEEGGLDALGNLTRSVQKLQAAGVDATRFVRSREAYDQVRAHYLTRMPEASFIDFYWGWRSIVQSVISTIQAPIPRAKAYHAISTGYAGLFQARAHIETGRPTLVTEHGIYTNERRMEITLATWIRQGLRRRISVHNEFPDIDGLWEGTFEAISRTCYDASDRITTLYGANSQVQASDGAAPEKLVVVPNGVDVEGYAGMSRAGADQRPTIALIGRVAPIKDIKSYIKSVDLIRQAVPDILALVIGPTDEDEDYFRECEALVAKLGLVEHIRFTGMAKIKDWLPSIHVLLLTSLSEAQPLIILEGGAAGIPFVTTNVGACEEMLLGAADETPNLGPGGILVGLVDPQAIADGAISLLTDKERRTRFGDNLRRRVNKYYRAETVMAQYSTLYDSVLEAR
ncbi:MAG: GT4 family glycosyltransferase PelF [Devosia sp.]